MSWGFAFCVWYMLDIFGLSLGFVVFYFLGGGFGSLRFCAFVVYLFWFDLYR